MVLIDSPCTAAACTAREGGVSARNDDEIYYRERERQARVLAAQANDPGVQQIHLQFATAYARRIRHADKHEAA